MSRVDRTFDKTCSPSSDRSRFQAPKMEGGWDLRWQGGCLAWPNWSNITNFKAVDSSCLILILAASSRTFTSLNKKMRQSCVRPTLRFPTISGASMHRCTATAWVVELRLRLYAEEIGEDFEVLSGHLRERSTGIIKWDPFCRDHTSSKCIFRLIIWWPLLNLKIKLSFQAYKYWQC